MKIKDRCLLISRPHQVIQGLGLMVMQFKMIRHVVVDCKEMTEYRFSFRNKNKFKFPFHLKVITKNNMSSNCIMPTPSNWNDSTQITKTKETFSIFPQRSL